MNSPAKYGDQGKRGFEMEEAFLGRAAGEIIKAGFNADLREGRDFIDPITQKTVQLKRDDRALNSPNEAYFVEYQLDSGEGTKPIGSGIATSLADYWIIAIPLDKLKKRYELRIWHKSDVKEIADKTTHTLPVGIPLQEQNSINGIPYNRSWGKLVKQKLLNERALGCIVIELC